MVSTAESRAKHRLPTFFLTHGGGPLPLLGDPSHRSLIEHWTQLRKHISEELKPRTKAILIISGHWEEPVATVTTGHQSPGLTYDYYNFPAEAYDIKYQAPGSPVVSERVRTLLRDRGIKTATVDKRGFDHGVFVPLKALLPDADIPVVQLSMLQSMDPAAHLEIGKALAPLREEGVLIIGSGSSFHSIRAMMTQSGKPAWAKEFDDYLTTSVMESKEKREEMLKEWERAPHARYAHPREDHLVPLFVAAGAAGEGKGSSIYSDTLMSVAISSFRFD